MKGKLFSCVALFVALASSISQADPVTVTVDENGNGTFGTTPVTGSLVTDPTGATMAKVLTYSLPTVVVAGNIAIQESVDPDQGGSDLIEFVTTSLSSSSAPHSLLVFISDPVTGSEPPDLADIRILFGGTIPVAKTFVETGPPNGPNGLTYTPGPNDPGFSSTSSLTYNIVSDAAGVPLPTSAWAGLALLMGLGARRVICKRVTI